MKKTLIAFVIIIAFLNCSIRNSNGNDLLNGKYKLRTSVYGFKNENEDMNDLNKIFSAGTGSTFTFLQQEQDDYYRIIFKKIIKSEVTRNNYETVSENNIYKIHKNNMKCGSYFLKYGISHGPLVVPFKYRTTDGRLTGEATIGYYMGVKSEGILGERAIFFSGGLALIPISKTNSEDLDQRTGFSAAIGYGFKTKSNFQIGLIFGIDHLGGEEGEKWKYEENLWLSLAMGFNFMK